MAASSIEGLDQVENIKGISSREEKKNITDKLNELELKEVGIIDELYKGHFRMINVSGSSKNEKQGEIKKEDQEDDMKNYITGDSMKLVNSYIHQDFDSK
jgi:hypothetical protein